MNFYFSNYCLLTAASLQTQNLTLEDILQIGLQQGTPLSRIRTPMRDIVNNQLLRGQPPSADNINQAVDRMMHEIPLVNMLQVRLSQFYKMCPNIYREYFTELESDSARHQHQ
jgi:hypothetical protein